MAIGNIEELRTGARKNAGYMSKLTDLDRILGGFQPGTLNIIAARHSMGKTVLALELGEEVEISSIATGILSEYEMYTPGRAAADNIARI